MRNGADPAPAPAPVVAHVLTRLVVGGPSRPVLSVLERLPARGLDPALVTGRAGEAEERLLLSGRLTATVRCSELTTLVRDPSVLSDLRALLRLAARLRRLRPVLVHTHTAKAGALGRTAARLAVPRAARVHTFHGHSLDPVVSGGRAGLWRAIERRLARRTDALLAVSPGQRSDLLLRLGPESDAMGVQPLAFDADAYPPAPPGAGASLRAIAPADGRVLLFVGRGVPVKGLVHLAEAAVRLAETAPDAAARLAFAIVGPVEPEVKRALLERLAGAAVPRWVFWGPVQNPLPLVEAADAVVLPSLSEGTPVSLLEALWFGKPVFASAVGGVPELLAADWQRHGPGEWTAHPAPARGRLLPAGDAAAWAAALARFAAGGDEPGDPVERRRFVEAVFDPERAADDTVAIYERLRALYAARRA